LKGKIEKKNKIHNKNQNIKKNKENQFLTKLMMINEFFKNN
jgi:hypothetical protein